NNVIRTVAPEQKTKINLYQEGAILCKQFQGKALTPEEQCYEDASKEIDVPSEILNGVRYSAMALMGNNLCTSISSAINQGLWSHVPAIMGYTSAIVFGPKLIQGAVEKALAYSGLTAEQKKQLTPWLNTIGRLALGFMPKVSANEQGVKYRHPSVKGHTRIATAQGSVTLGGEHGMQFKLYGIREITQDKITLTVMNEAGKKTALEFTVIQNGLDEKIVAKSSEKNLEDYWNQEIRSTLPAMQRNDLTCQSALVVGAVASAVGQNALPALVASLSCWPQVSAYAEMKNEPAASVGKRAVMQQQFPAIFNLGSLDGTNGFIIQGLVSNGHLGSSISTAGDINGDYIDDVVLGAPRTTSSASHVIFGSQNPFSAVFNVALINGTNGFTIPGTAASGILGLSAGSGGDINGDNITDLVLGAPYANSSIGAGYVIFGRRSPFPASFDINQLDGTNGFTIPGIEPFGYLGNSPNIAGDINGDSIDDLVLAAYNATSGMGVSYVVFGSRSPFPATFNLTQLTGTNGFTIPGTSASGYLGYSSSAAGDMNCDKIIDLALGALNANSGLGAIYVIFGSRNQFPATFNLDQLNGTNGFTVPGIVSSGNCGSSVSIDGDINGDDLTDLVIGAYGVNIGMGASYVIFGNRDPFPASFNLTGLNGTNGFAILAKTTLARLGNSVTSAGDINGDQISDLVLGAYNAYSGVGTSYVIFGQKTAVGNLTPTPTPTPTPTSFSTPAPTPVFLPLTPCPVAQSLTIQNNGIQISQAQTLRLTPNDLSVHCGNNTAANLATLFNITAISYAQLKTRNSSGVWNNVSSFLGNDLSQGNVELVQDSSTFAPQINFTVTDGQMTLPETVANVQFSTTTTTPAVTAIDINIQKNGTTTLTAQQFQLN
ncbi:MAG: hypothetical protein EOO88_31740, partial [Pedobacter sp.]